MPMCRARGIARLLKRKGMARLEDVIPKAEGETIAPKNTFKDYEPGFIHIDIKYLQQMRDETTRRYLLRESAIGRNSWRPVRIPDPPSYSRSRNRGAAY
jgi:hypothetical protein